MTHRLILGDRAYSSWSLRAALLVDRFDLPVETDFISFLGKSVAEQLTDTPPARTVPTLVLDDGSVVWDSLAVAETLADLFPDAGLWPAGISERATARALASEMHSGFAALRTMCPMNLRVAYRDWDPGLEVAEDLRRIDVIWDHALTRSGGPWLCGDYSIADAFFAPVAARIAGYGLSISDSASSYVAAHLAEPTFRAWRAKSLTDGPDLPQYVRDYPQTDWPG
ncbi:glutathione S-transferase [Aestuariibius sp. 2305UL40-4]|uniref:glutathione S-transferase n=1 Tax=Aestuariibius violaceus TaxID=3234132 RepID=UPI00345F0427